MFVTTTSISIARAGSRMYPAARVSLRFRPSARSHSSGYRLYHATTGSTCLDETTRGLRPGLCSTLHPRASRLYVSSSLYAHRVSVTAAQRRRCPSSAMSTIAGPRTQPIDAPLTQFATFIVLSVERNADAIRTVRSTLAKVSDVVKNVAFRDASAQLTCTVGIGSDVWPELTRQPKPRELHPFREIRGAVHTAVSTPGDLLLHIRAERRDIAFELERQLFDLLGDAVRVVDETVGFRYFDVRDLLGFVDGTANPVGPDVPAATLVTAQDDGGVAAEASVGGSYVVVQKYVHDMASWGRLSTEAQEAIIGRRKFDNVELDDAPPGKQRSHKTLATIEDENGDEYAILRDNMPFGSPGSGEFGTYFIGYSARLWVIERMLERMFVGDPPGLHDRILDFSRPLTGTTFFVPPVSLLESLDED
ncbi:hypothetical protein VTK73DRAFT_7233 [Phialemonium thermophilum]|uniref:Dyp-type peroxidase n=1 Tax=Phialemonium thermophilum TaxID=223376 RepID=A0ABR3WFN6_9PEZI